MGTGSTRSARPEQLLQLKDLDAVIISTPEHSHSPLLKMAIDAGKDVYSEKPMGNVLGRSKSRPRRRVEEQSRSSRLAPSMQPKRTSSATREFIRTGALGDVTKYEVEWNYHGPRWRGRPEVKQIARKTRIGPYGL